MTLTLATLLPGLLLLVLGALLLVQNSAIVAFFKALPRSQTATLVFFGSATLFFLYRVWHLSEADFGNYRTPLFIGFAIVAALAFKFVPDFLAVRGMAALMLLVAMPLLDAGYMNYEPPQIFLYKVAVYLGIVLAIYLGAAPYRLRDFLDWLFRVPGRARVLGGGLLAYGLLLAVVAFTY